MIKKDHSRVSELLPWYVNDTLAGRELEQVLVHLKDCEPCQTERDRLYELQAIVRESMSEIPDHEMSYRRTLKRIESFEQNRQSVQELPDFKRQTRFSRWQKFGVAASILFVCGLAATELSNWAANSVEPVEYQTLSTETAGIPGLSHRMELGFVNPIPASTLRQALIETRSNIVSGPDEQGNYVVEVIVPDNMSVDSFVAKIRDIEGVEHARFTGN